MSTLHLLCGLPCSGKTTYSQKLIADHHAIHFCLDYWLINLFGHYSIEAVGREEHTRRVLACRKIIWNLSAEILQKGNDVILDDGFFFRRHRVECIAVGKTSNAHVRVHYLDVPNEVLRARIMERNAALPEYNFLINPGLLDAFRQIFEVPGADEGAELVHYRGQ